MDTRLLISPREACYRLGGISQRHLWNLTRRGLIPCVRLGRRVFYRPADLEAFLESVARHQAEAAAEVVEGQGNGDAR
jgi:hypothetical protein